MVSEGKVVELSDERLNLQGVASLRDGTWDGRRVVYEEPKFVYIRVGRSPIRVAGLAENRRLEWRGGV